MKSFLITSGNFFFKYRNAIFPIVFVLLFLTSKPSINENFWNRVTVIAGILITLSGQAFRLAVIGYAYIKRGGKEGRVYADHLVVKGFYNHSRNPMYIGNMMILMGFCMIYGSFAAYFFVIPFFIYAYYAIVVAEEDYLRDKFQHEYREYERTVNRFIPNFKGIRSSLKEFHYDWKRAIRKDYGTIWVTLSGIWFIFWIKDCYISGFNFMIKNFEFINILIIITTLYFLARILKKTKFLASPN